MRKVMVCGCGVQGTTICRKLDLEPNVEEIICADYDIKIAEEVCKMMKKGKPVKVDASNIDEIVKAAEGCELIVNVMPLDFGVNVLEAAIRVKANYQDLAACENIADCPDPRDNWLEGIKIMYNDYGKRFAENGTTAIIGTGSAPGVMCVVARKAVNELDTCDTMNMMVYEGVEAKRFLPYWWSPLVALSDMEEDAYAFENGKQIRTTPFSRPVKRCWPEMGGREVTMVEHAHDEPVYVGFNSDTFFKGCKNAYFKYGGVGVQFAEAIYRAGLLSHEEEEIRGRKVVPFDVVLAHTPAPPKTPAEIKEILDEGLVADEGAFVCEAYGKKDGKDVMVDLHVFAPGVVEAYEKDKMSGEMYLTGQGAFLFTKLFVNNKINQPGLISSDMLSDEQVEQYLAWAKELDITYEIEIKDGVVWEDK